MKISKIIYILSTPGAVLFILIAIYANYQSLMGHGAVSVTDVIVYLFIYSIISFVLWIGSILLS